MKKIISALLFFSCNYVFAQKDSFYIKATINNLPPGNHKIDFCFTGEKMDSVVYSDTISPDRNIFFYRGTTSVEMLATIKIKRVISFDFALGPSDTAILELTYKSKDFNYKIEGTNLPKQMVNYLYKAFLPQSLELKNKRKLMDSLSLNTEGNISQVEKEKISYDSLYERYFDYNTAFADTTVSASAAYHALYRYFTDTGKYNVYKNVEQIIERFPPNPAVQALDKDFKIWQNSSTKLSKDDTLSFSLFPVSTQRDIKKVFNKQNAKLILIDFWASWCGPCREEFPFLDEAYKKFQLRGFDIVSISLDKDETLWRKAMASLKPLWKNHSIDVKAWNSKIVKSLNIKSIPRNYLVDRNGKIYGKDLRGIEVSEILGKLL